VHVSTETSDADNLKGLTMNLIAQLEKEEMARLDKTIPDFAPGDTVVVQVKVKEGTREPRASASLRRRGHRRH
jgi:hypothetical protein